MSGGFLTDIRTYTLSLTELQQKREHARNIGKQRNQHSPIGPETLFLPLDVETPVDPDWIPQHVSSPHKHSETSDGPWIQNKPIAVMSPLPSSSLPKPMGVELLPSSSSPRF
jgi:hypothetical protein